MPTVEGVLSDSLFYLTQENFKGFHYNIIKFIEQILTVKKLEPETVLFEKLWK